MATRVARRRGPPEQARRRGALGQARRPGRPRTPLRRYLGPLLLVGLLFAGGLGLLRAARPDPVPAPLAEATAASDETGLDGDDRLGDDEDGDGDGDDRGDALLDGEAIPDGDSAPRAMVTRLDPRELAKQRMREAVFAPLRGLPSRFGIAVKDLGSGLDVSLNESFPFQAASLYKLPVMYEVFKLRESGVLRFQEEMAIGPADAAMDLGSLPWPIGTRITLGTALERMVTLSDNTAAFMLTRRVGASRINEDALELGLRQTRIKTEDLTTSAQDMLRLLEMMAEGQAVDADTSAEMVHLMARQQIRDRIPAYLPPEATVANKTGNWEGAVHDVALVYTPRATLAVALLSDGASGSDAVNSAMAQVGRNLYDLVNDPTFDTSAEPPLPPAERPSYAAAPKLPPPNVTSAPRPPGRPAINPMAPVPARNQNPTRTTQPVTAAPTNDGGGTTPAGSQTQPAQTQPAQTQPPQVTRPAQRETSAPPANTSAPAPTTQRRAATAPAAAPRSVEAPKPTEPPKPKPEAPKPEAAKPETPKPTLPPLFAPGNGGGPAAATPRPKPQSQSPPNELQDLTVP